MARLRLVNISWKSVTAFFLNRTFRNYATVHEKHAIDLPAFKLSDEVPIYNDGYTNYMRTLQAPYFTEHLF